MSDFFNDARENAFRRAPVSAIGANEFEARRSFTPNRRFTDVLLIGDVAEPQAIEQRLGDMDSVEDLDQYYQSTQVNI